MLKTNHSRTERFNLRKFNVTGVCVPSKHYMVDIGNKLKEIVKLVDDGSYFTINRARQYGKTTTLHGLSQVLKFHYTVISISFEGLGEESFSTAEIFCQKFLKQISKALRFTTEAEEYRNAWLDSSIVDFELLSEHITNMCENRKLVLMIDEVDKVSNNKTFLNFLSVLRSKYLASQMDVDFTFHSVILAGVYDVKNIKLKLINEGNHTPTATEGKIYNSPWNIAVDFEVDMSFHPQEISTMLDEYEADHHTGMEITAISEEIYRYTSGYPFLVSKICKYIDEKLDKDWTVRGVQKAVHMLVKEKNTLFDDLSKNLENNKELYDLIYDVLIIGRPRTFSVANPTIELGVRYGYIKQSEQTIMVSNKIFEIIICNYFISKDESINPNQIKGVLQNDIVERGRFNMELCLKKFAQHYGELFTEKNREFLESHGRMLFLTYLKPLLNGRGFYHIESQFTDMRRMDIVVDFGSDQFIIELKLWKGETAQEKAYDQLLGYMNSKHADKGYLLTFDFRKGENKECKAEWIQIGDKQIFDVIV